MSVKEILDSIDIVFSKDNKGNIWYNNKCTPNIYNLDRKDIHNQGKIFYIYDSLTRNNMIENMTKQFDNLTPYELNLFCLLFDDPRDLSNYVYNNMNNMNEITNNDIKHFFFD